MVNLVNPFSGVSFMQKGKLILCEEMWLILSCPGLVKLTTKMASVFW